MNIIGRGRRNGEDVLIVGECKSQLKKADIDKFISFIKRAKDILPENKILIAVTYQASPLIRKYAEHNGVKLYLSYEIPI